MRGRSCTQPFLVEKQTRYPLSPRRPPSPAPLGESIAPSSAPVCALGHLPPKGKALGVGRTLPVCETTRPSPPSRWAGRYGPRIQGRRPGKKRRRTPAGSPKLEKVGPGRKNLFLPGVLSSGFLPKKAGPPPGAGRATGRCAPRLRKSPDHPKGTQYHAAPPPGAPPLHVSGSGSPRMVASGWKMAQKKSLSRARISRSSR